MTKKIIRAATPPTQPTPDDLRREERALGLSFLDSLPDEVPGGFDYEAIVEKVIAIAMAELANGVNEPPRWANRNQPHKDGWWRIDKYIRMPDSQVGLTADREVNAHLKKLADQMGLSLEDLFPGSKAGLCLGSAEVRSRQGVPWPAHVPYYYNNEFSWCGAFVAWCLGMAGLPLRLRRALMSCYKMLIRLGHWNEVQRFKPDNFIADVSIDPRTARRGDLLTVGRKKDVRRGSHIVMVVSRLSDNEVETVEGNAGFEGREGVIHRTRVFESPGSDDWIIKKGYRLSDSGLWVP
jgi:hypothetical protein